MLSSFGFLKVVLEGADLLGFAPGSTKAKVIIASDALSADGRRVAVLKSVPTVSNTKDPTWGVFFDVRCCPGWTVDIELLVTTKQGSSRLIIETIEIGTGRGGVMPLYMNGQETSSTLSVLVEFFPNHSDMYCLSRDCILESYLPKLLTEELLQSAINLISCKEEDGQKISNFMLSVEKSFQRLLSCLNSDSLKLILAKHLHEAMGDDIASISSAHFTRTRGSPPLLAADHTLTFPDEIETYRAVACARQFFRYILKDFKAHVIPDPTVGLVEKLLTLYMAAAQDIIDERSSMRSPSAATQLDENVTFSLFVDFVLVASVWYLEHAFAYVNITDECSVSPVEINAIWTRFQLYDASLAGYIMSSDVFLLLQDMGETYTPDEMDLILREVDSDGIGIVELSSFLQWWASA